eukprot:TRINITY_DN52802_c0_g1_i1.p1 TRINITY_DN52802_c0_g1~~TRINITY_DN52802_c0_g1_i1.p1  ORF type:complete len:247 (+),score=59.71 TRINITY_DN52802_c0_g1_i1:157-897(+)
MSQKLAIKRLRQDLRGMKREPIEGVFAKFDEGNLLHVHFLIYGSDDTPYSGGIYHGILKFPSNYPMKPPSIMMYTPSGRFEVNKRLCFSLSDFHPESWNPMWTVSKILLGVQSFMNCEEASYGAISNGDFYQRRVFAKKSMENNAKFPKFCQLFPKLVENYEEEELGGGNNNITGEKTEENLEGSQEEEEEFTELPEKSFDLPGIELVEKFLKNKDKIKKTVCNCMFLAGVCALVIYLGVDIFKSL